MRPKPVSLSMEAARELNADQGKVVEFLAKTTNPFYRDVNTLLTNGLTVNEHFKGGIIVLKIQTQGDPDDAFPVRQSLPFVGECGFVKCGGARRLSGSGVIQTAVEVTDWEQAGKDAIKINYITGLDSDTSYELRLLVLAA